MGFLFSPELYTLQRCTLRHNNYISVELLLKKKKETDPKPIPVRGLSCSYPHLSLIVISCLHLMRTWIRRQLTAGKRGGK
jgi:hypothetical protein